MQQVIEHEGKFYVDGYGWGRQWDGSIGPDKYRDFGHGFGPGYSFDTRQAAEAAASIENLGRAEGRAEAMRSVRAALGMKD